MIYYRDVNLKPYKILEETMDSYICESLDGEDCGKIFVFNKECDNE
jgi:hypothetical protein